MALVGAADITTTTTPSMGNINSYDATAGNLAVTLPALSGLPLGANAIVEKSVADKTYNTVTFTRSGSDLFDDGATTCTISTPGEKVVLQVVSEDGGTTRKWKITALSYPKTGLLAATTQTVLASSNTLTTLATTTLPAASLNAGSTFLITLDGTIQVKATSGTFTFTPYLQNTALNTAQMASQGSAAGPVGFHHETRITVRSTGATGTALAKHFGLLNFATAIPLLDTNTATTTVDTSSAAASTALALKGQWETSDAANSLKIETATIERII